MINYDDWIPKTFEEFLALAIEEGFGDEPITSKHYATVKHLKDGTPIPIPLDIADRHISFKVELYKLIILKR